MLIIARTTGVQTLVMNGTSNTRLRNDLYCVGWGVKLYSLSHFVGTGKQKGLESLPVITSVLLPKNRIYALTVKSITSELIPFALL